MFKIGDEVIRFRHVSTLNRYLLDNGIWRGYKPYDEKKDKLKVIKVNTNNDIQISINGIELKPWWDSNNFKLADIVFEGEEYI